MSHVTDHDDRELARLGYKQRLNRTLGLGSAFAVSYGFVAILLGIVQLFFLGFGSAGPAFFWAYPIVGVLQFMSALCLAEMAGQVPVAGSLYQWARQVATSRFVPWLTGWFLVAALLVTMGICGPTMQALLTTLSSKFQLVGGSADVGSATTHNGAVNAIILGSILIAVLTFINIVGVRWAARALAVAITIELATVAAVVIGLVAHITRGPGIVFATHGTGAGHSWGWFGAFLIGTISAAYVFFGFESAATLAEETKDPRRTAPRAMLRSLAVSVPCGIVLVALGLMAVKDVHAEELGTIGFPYLVQSTLGTTMGNIVLIGVVVAVLGAGIAVQATGGRIIFAMARDGQLPFSRRLAHVSPRWKTPTAPILLTAVAGELVMLLNYGNPRIFSTIASLLTLLFYICYLMLLGALLASRRRGEWPPDRSGAHFSLGRWGLPINVIAVLSTVAIIVNVAWPRAAVFGSDHWYLQYGAFVLVGLLLIIGVPYYLAVQRGRRAEVMPEHRPDAGDGLRAETAPAVTPVFADGAVDL